MIFETTSIFKVENSEKQKFKNYNPEPTPRGDHQEPLNVHFRATPSAQLCFLGPVTPGPAVCRGHSRSRPHVPPGTPADRALPHCRHSPSSGSPGSKPTPPNKEPPGAASTFPVMGLPSTSWGAGPRGMDPGVAGAARGLASHFWADPLLRSILGSQEAGRPLLRASSPPNPGQTLALWSPSSLSECRGTPGGHREPSQVTACHPTPTEETRGHPGRRDLAVAGGLPETLIRARRGGLSWG